MTTYNEGKHPRGQAGNAGQFRNKSWSDPEVDLVTMPPRVDLDTWEPGEDVDADAQVLEELQWVRDGVAAQRSPATIADEIVGSAYAENVGNRTERSVNEMLIELAAVGGITWDMLAAAAYAGQLNSPPVLAPHATTDFLASASRDSLAGPGGTPDAIVEPLVEGASFEALAGTNGYHYLNALLATAANHAQLAQAKAVIDDIIQDEGNYGDATADEYAEYAIRHGLLPHTVHKWAYLIGSATPTR